MSTVFTKTFSAPPLNKGEILRYTSAKELTPEASALLESCIAEAEGLFTYKVCYAHFPIYFCDECIDLSFIKTNSKHLRKSLSDCQSVLVFAATVGLEIDRLIARYGKTSPTKALMMQAIGAERIEALCDEFTLFAEKEFGHSVPRFSPGYGDLPIEIQKDFFRVLEPDRKIGLTLNESMLMTPSKSVTAIIGISGKPQTDKSHNCADCDKKNCLYRRLV